MKKTYRILIDSSSIGRRFVGKQHCKARQQYMMAPEQALELVDFEQAKEFCQTWAKITGADFFVQHCEREMFRAKGAKR